MGNSVERLGQIILSSLIAFVSSVAYSQTSSDELQAKNSFPIKLAIYSESLYDARFDGAVTETRFRLYPKSFLKIQPYLGLAVSQDLSNGRSPLLVENMLAPTLGIQVRPLKFFYLFAENRYLFRFQNELRSNSENEFRYGSFIYHFQTLTKHWFNETYAELVSVDRVDDRPVTVGWNKLGHRFQLDPSFRIDLYAEGFFRMSPNPGYGPDENELRLGLRSSYLQGYWAVSMVLNYAVFSDVKPGGADALLVISREVY